MTLKSVRNHRDLRTGWGRRIALALLLSGVAAILGPFSTYDLLSFPQRLFYWCGLTFTLLAPAVFLRAWVIRHVPGTALWADSVGAFALGLFVGVLVWAFNVVFMEGFATVSAASVLEHVFGCVVICFLPVGLRVYLRKKAEEMTPSPAAPSGAPAPETPAPAPNPGPALSRRLPAELHGAILRVSADDHQLLVVTDQGQTHIRMRFSDAEVELDPTAGTRIHRSHWVAFAVVDDLRAEGRRHVAVLSNGTELPVSQTHVEALRAGIDGRA